MVEVRSERHWYGLLGAVAMGCLFLGLLSTILYSVLKKKPSTPTLTVVEPVPSLIAAQAKYDQKKTGAAWKSLTPLFLVFALLILVRGPAMDDMAMWLPPASPAVIGLIPLFIFIPFLAVLVAGKRSKPKPNPVSTQFSWVLAVFIVPFVLLLLVLLIQMNAPQWLYWIPAPVLSTTVRIIGLLPLPLIAIVWLVKSKRGTLNFSENLGPGDSDYDTAIEIGALAGVKVRRVRVLNHVKSANALVGVTGTIGLTQGFRDKLSPEEKRCVIAHEIGHLKGRHVWVLLAFSLCVVGPIWFMSTKLKGPYEFLAPFVPIVLIIVPMLARSPIQRKYEYAADKFALETIGSFDEVGGALAKIHLLNAAPHTLRKFDAALSSHPSLTKRLEYLRKTANEMGLSVPEDAVQKLIEAAVLENPGDATGDSPSPSPA